MDIEQAISRLESLREQMEPLLEQVTQWVGRAAEDKKVKPADVGVGLFLIKRTHEVYDKGTKVLYHAKDRLDKGVMPERLADYDLDLIRVPGIARSFSVLNKTSASMVDKDKGFEWLRQNGLGDLIQETVNAGTLASAMRNLLLDQGLEPPEDVIKVTSYKATSVNKYTPK